MIYNMIISILLVYMETYSTLALFDITDLILYINLFQFCII